jgi:phage gp46-like protein
MVFRVRIGEGAEAQPNLLWDSVWSPPDGVADWQLADADEAQNRGGLRAKTALHTAVILCLFTDRRLPENHPLAYLVAEDADPRGWFGDGEDVRDDQSETEMGSLLWIFERSILTAEIGRWVEAIALEALQPLIAQNAAARIEAKASVQSAVNRCDLAVQIYGKDGSRIYDFRFEDIWRQTATAPAPRPFPDYPPR